MSGRRGFLWIIGGLALGFGIALLLGVLIFWAWPAYRRARSPLGELCSGQIVLRYLKESPVAAQAPRLAAKLDREWEEVKELLAIPEGVIPPRVYVYAYDQAGELPVAYSVRTAEETTPAALVDLLADQPAAGALARLACSLAYGGPGNPVFPRGLVRYLDQPEASWAAEVVAYGMEGHWQLLFEHPNRLLPQDPWEKFFFNVDAPWVGATPSLETVRYLLTASSASPQQARAWEATAAAFAGFVLREFGAAGARAFWLASGWQKGAQALGWTPDEFAAAWEAHLEEEFTRAAQDPLMLAKQALYSGHPSLALEHLAGIEGPEADRFRALAHLALGEPVRALEYLPQEQAEELAPLAAARVVGTGRLWLVGLGERDWEGLLLQANAALERALGFWGLSQADLPERLVLYLTELPPPQDLPWGVIWAQEEADPVYQVVEFALAMASPLGLPLFDTLTRGLALVLSYPDRDFRGEAAVVLQQGKWVDLSQPLFDAYPLWIAEAEAGAMVEYLLEQNGPPAIKGLWQDLLSGDSPFSAVSRVLGISLDELDRRLRAWASG